VAIVPYSPLGRGFLTGKIRGPEQFGERDFRSDIPLFETGNFEANLRIVEELRDIAAARHCTASQVALAWLKTRGDDVFPIPGTKRRTWLKENIGSLQVVLDSDDIGRIERVSALVRGARKNTAGMELIDRSVL